MSGNLGQEYNVYDTGLDKNLVRGTEDSLDIPFPDLSIPNEVTSDVTSTVGDFSGGLVNPTVETTAPTDIRAGELPSLIGFGKKKFTDTIAGFLMGLDGTDNIYKWIVGGATSSADWAVTTPNTFTVNGVIVATVGGRIANWYINTNTISSGAVEATSNVLIDSANSLIRLGSTAGNYITLDGANLRERSSNYVAGVSGFTIEPTLIEAENLIGRGTLRGSVFSYDRISSVGGQMMVASADTLATDMTALDASTLTIKGDTTFAVNDILVIRAVATSGVQEEWFRVTNVGSAPTYTVTRDLASLFSANSNPIWKAGTPVVKQGVSDGGSSYSGGWLRLIGEGTNSPFYSVYGRTGVAYNSYAERVRLGNLNGIGAFVADTYGIFIGNYSTGKYLTYDDASGNLDINGFVQTSQGAFGGDGSDGALTVSSGTTSIDLGGLAFVVKNYTSVSITGTGKVAFTNPHATGTILVIKSKGNVTITSSTTPALDFSGMGSSLANNPNGILDSSNHYGANGSTVYNDPAATGGSTYTANILYTTQTGYLYRRCIFLVCGTAGGNGLKLGGGGGGSLSGAGGNGATAGGGNGSNAGGSQAGGGGGSATNSTPGNQTAAAGIGGGALLIECGGDINFTATISVAGTAGGNAADIYSGGGGGGSGGMCIILYNGAATAVSGTINSAGATGGTGGNGGTSGGTAGASASGLIQKNFWF